MRHPLENIQKAIENGPFTVHLPIKNGLAAQTTPQIWGMESKKKTDFHSLCPDGMNATNIWV